MTNKNSKFHGNIVKCERCSEDHFESSICDDCGVEEEFIVDGCITAVEKNS